MKLLLPVKSLATAKTRLAPVLDAVTRRRLALAMLEDVLSALVEANLAAFTEVLTRDPQAVELATHHAIATRQDPRDGSCGINQLLDTVFQQLAHETEAVAVLPADLPLLDAHQLPNLLFTEEANKPTEKGVVLASNRHGEGTNFLVQRPPALFAPSYGAGSYQRHLKLALAAGAMVKEMGESDIDSGLDLDVDTPEDLEELERRMAVLRPSRAARTRDVLGF